MNEESEKIIQEEDFADEVNNDINSGLESVAHETHVTHVKNTPPQKQIQTQEHKHGFFVDDKIDILFERDGCAFTIPKRPNVRQQLEYFSATANAVGSQMLIRFWVGARELITNWECESIPDLKISLEDMTDPSQTAVIMWASLKVKEHMNGLEDMPPNS